MRILMAALIFLGCAMTGPAGTAPQEPLRVTVSAPQTPVARGAPVALALQVSNVSDRAVTLHFNTSQRYDFVIHDGSGREVWSWSQERMFLQVLGQEVIEPGAGRSYEERFLGTLPPGTYRVTGRLAARETTPAATATFVIE
jgi:hypothetical protein